MVIIYELNDFVLRGFFMSLLAIFFIALKSVQIKYGGFKEFAKDPFNWVEMIGNIMVLLV